MVKFRVERDSHGDIDLKEWSRITHSPINMEVENYANIKETNLGGAHFPLP